MKKIKLLKIGIALIICSVLSGCAGFLDNKPRGEDVAATIAHYEGLFNATPLMSMTYLRSSGYGSLSTVLTEILANYLSDEWVTDKAGLTAFNTYAKEAAVKTYKYEDDVFNSTEYSAIWGGVYSHLYTYNVIINGVMDAVDGTAEQKEQIRAEARVMRAYMLFICSQCFGQPYNESTAQTDLAVPIVTKADVSEADFRRASVKELYEFLIDEMTEACPELPNKDVHPLRTYKAAGYAMLGKIYWMKGDYQNALSALNTAKSLLDKDNNVSLYDYNAKLKEWGYVAALPNSFPVTSKYPSNQYQSTETVYTKQFIIVYIVLFAYPGSLYIKPEFMDLFGKNDCRRAFFPAKTYKNVAYPYCRPMKSTGNLGVNLPDIILMLAECKARTNDLDGAKNDLYSLRKNRMPEADAVIPENVSDKDALIRFIIDERKREFMGTGLRWMDMRRLWFDPLFQEDKKGYTHTDGETTWIITKDRLTLKIPPVVLQWNPTWKDND